MYMEHKALLRLSSKLSKLFNQLNNLLTSPNPVSEVLLIRDIIKNIEYNSLLYRREAYRILHLKENKEENF